MERLNELIFILCLRENFKSIRVYDSTAPFDLLMLIPVEEVSLASYPVSGITFEYIYVADFISACIWKITLHDHQVRKWLCNLKSFLAVTITLNGQVVVLHRNETSGNKFVEIYGSDAVLILAMDVTNDLNPLNGILDVDLEYTINTTLFGNGNHYMAISMATTSNKTISLDYINQSESY